MNNLLSQESSTLKIFIEHTATPVISSAMIQASGTQTETQPQPPFHQHTRHTQITSTLQHVTKCNPPLPSNCLMATLLPPSPSSSPTRMPRKWARKCERYCCLGATYFPLFFVYSITTWAVWVEATIGFLPAKSAWIGMYLWNTVLQMLT